MPCDIEYHYLFEWGPYSFQATGLLLACWTALL